MPKPKYKYVLLHKPTGKFVSRNSNKYTHSRWVRSYKDISNFLVDDINDCRVFTNKSSAHNSTIYQNHKDELEAVPCKLVIVT